MGNVKQKPVEKLSNNCSDESRLLNVSLRLTDHSSKNLSAHLSEEKNDQAQLYNRNVFAATALSKDPKNQDFDEKDNKEMLIDLTSPQHDGNHLIVPNNTFESEFISRVYNMGILDALIDSQTHTAI